SIFLQIFLFKLAGFNQVILFNITALIFLLIFYLTSAWTLKLTSSKRLIQTGLLTFSLMWVLILFLGEQSVYYIIPLGILMGIGHGHYWSGFNLSQYILTSQEKRDHYFGKGTALIYLATSLGPIIGGFIIFFGNQFLPIPFIGYYILFFIVLILNFLIFLFAANLPSHSGIEFDLTQIITHKRISNWKSVLSQQFLFGMYDHIFNTLSAILLFLILNSESQLGTLTTFSSFLTAVISFTAGRLLSKHKNLYKLGAIGASLGILFFGLLQNWVGIALLVIFFNIGTPFLTIPTSSAILNTIDEYKESWQKKYFLLLERDTVLGVARILSYILLFAIFNYYGKEEVAKNFLIFISIFPLLIGFLFGKMRWQYKI
ncbi:hypothetical protein A3I50_02395, partial [Candidatus Roizmanbacteria bacterium RIFCSPLOWO2_02_FULL_37_9]